MTDDKKPRGFAAMTKEQRTAIARKGGQALRPDQRSFSQDRQLARMASEKAVSLRETKMTITNLEYEDLLAIKEVMIAREYTMDQQKELRRTQALNRINYNIQQYERRGQK